MNRKLPIAATSLIYQIIINKQVASIRTVILLFAGNLSSKAQTDSLAYLFAATLLKICLIGLPNCSQDLALKTCWTYWLGGLKSPTMKLMLKIFKILAYENNFLAPMASNLLLQAVTWCLECSLTQLIRTLTVKLENMYQ